MITVTQRMNLRNEKKRLGTERWFGVGVEFSRRVLKWIIGVEGKHCNQNAENEMNMKW